MKTFFWLSWVMLILAGLVGLLMPSLRALPPVLYLAYLFFCALAGAMALISTSLAFIQFLKSINGH